VAINLAKRFGNGLLWREKLAEAIVRRDELREGLSVETLVAIGEDNEKGTGPFHQIFRYLNFKQNKMIFYYIN
jgi:hypothetical protein